MPGRPSLIRRRRIVVLLSLAALIALILWLLSDSLFQPESGGGGEDRGGGAQPKTPIVQESDDPGPRVQNVDKPSDEGAAARMDSYLTAMQLAEEARKDGAAPADVFGAIEALRGAEDPARPDSETIELRMQARGLVGLLEERLRPLSGDTEGGVPAIDEAARIVRGLTDAVTDDTRAVLDRALDRAFLRGSLLRDDVARPVAPPDPSERPVVRTADGELLTATRAKGEFWTFRTEGGFRRVPRYECDWTGAGETADAAFAQCTAAIRAGDVAYAIAWYGRAFARDLDPERLRELSNQFRDASR